VVWEMDYDIYRDLKEFKGDRNFIPFRQLGKSFKRNANNN
jgi:hypothetical protein